MKWTGLAAATVATSILALSCGDEPAPPPSTRACANVTLEASASAAMCTPLYEPTYDNVFARTLQRSCATSGVSCHASTGRQAGLSFESAEESYRLLLDSTQAVRPGDPSCSALVGRLVATSGTVRMPPGRALDPAEQCAIIQWVANGARR